MKQEMIIHQDRNMRITRLLARRGNECKYKIEVTTGRAAQSYEKYCANDGEAFKVSWLKLKELQEKESGNVW